MSTENSYQFKASTSKVLQIITHSLYQNSEVYLRELISNASDALNKVRIKQIQSENILDPGAPLEITLTADKEMNTLTVSDTGIGLSQEEQNKLFKPFSQADSTTARKFGGTGLGLSISHTIVKNHGGNLTATSEIGKGSKFSFDLPH